MRGSPLIRALMVFLAILLLRWPLGALTRLDESNAKAGLNELPVSVGEVRSKQCEMEITFSKKAKRIEILHLGKTLWKREDPQLIENTSFQIPFPKEGVELLVRAEFGSPGPTAIRCRLTPEQLDVIDRSVWGEETIESVISFP